VSAQCINSDVGKLLHAYEIGQLSEGDVCEFEAHVIECRSCLDELISMEQSVAAMIKDEKLRSLIERAATHESTDRVAPTGLFDRLKGAFWPEGNWLFKPALAYAAVALLLYPAYLGLRSPGPDGPQVATTILLNTTRSVSAAPVAGDIPVVLFFRVFGHTEGDSYDLSLWTEADELLYRNPAFTAVDNRQMGTLSLPAGMIGSGGYRLVITRPDGSTVRDYPFELQ